MFTAENNELLTRIERDSPMGRLFKNYWLPACMSEEVAEPDGTPIRVRLLGENYVAFRDTNGKVGIMHEHCPHRRASLLLARNDDCGQRCIYHGWKMNVDGLVVDMPSEPPNSRMVGRIRHRAYPVQESGGFVWVYLGAVAGAADVPAFMAPPWANVNFAISKVQSNANWAQVVEGVLDSAHSSTLHSSNIRPGGKGDRTSGGDLIIMDRPTNDAAPRIQVQRTEYGFRYAAIRTPTQNADERDYVRVTVFMAPFFSVIPPNAHWETVIMHIPLDDEHTMQYSVGYSDRTVLDTEKFRERSGTRVGIELDDEYRPIRTQHNRYLQDRAAMKAGHFSGLQGVTTEDIAVNETMGPIADRTQEILAVSDMAIVQFRQMMLQAIRDHEAGGPAIGTQVKWPRADIRAFEGMIPKGVDWRTVAVTDAEVAGYVSQSGLDAA